MKTLLLFLTLFSLFFNNSLTYSQQSSGLVRGLPGGLTLTGYADVYISYDSDKGSAPRSFSAIAPYRDEFRLNMAQVSAKYANDKVRGTISLHYGDLPRLNWPADNQFIQEANIGFAPANNTWIDAGYFLTHIGGEGIFPMYNHFQSLSLCTYYEPFYQAGVKVSYTGKKFYGALHLLNGYNVLSDNNKNKSFGLTLGYKFNDKMDFTYNNIVGNEQPAGDPGKLRIYNNFLLKIYPAKNLDLIICGDLCYQEKSKISDPDAGASMFSAFVSMKYRLSKKMSFSLRGELLQDEEGVMTGRYTDTDNNLTGLKTFGLTGGIEYNHVENFYIRLETRYLAAGSKHKIFYDNTNNKVEMILSSGIQF